LLGSCAKLKKSYGGHRETEATEVMTRFEYSAGLSTKRPKGREGEQYWYEKCSAPEGAIEVVSPPGDETAFISATANDVGAHKGEEYEQGSEDFSPKARCSGKLWKGGARSLTNGRDATSE
jgi:hypothetical protein